MFNWKEVWDRRGKSDNGADETVGWDEVPINLEKVAKEITSLLDIQPDDKVLEVGSGTGSLAQYIEAICHYTGVDYSQPMIDKHLKNKLGAKIFLSEASHLPFPDKHFDKAFSFSVFHYFPDKAYAFDAISEMRRVTKGGIYIGDLPIKSHRKEHLLYSKDDFNGGMFTDGFYTKKRFNVIFI